MAMLCKLWRISTVYKYDGVEEKKMRNIRCGKNCQRSAIEQYQTNFLKIMNNRNEVRSG